MSNALAITVAEFGRALTSCRPPNAWGKSIAVAVSGGPDSLGLLWLLRTLYEKEQIKEPRIIGLTVDHGMRPESSAEAVDVGLFCRDLGIEHQVLKIPWGTPPYPEVPKPVDFEKTARWARYWACFQAMQQAGANALLTGHQADDQLETAIMRAQSESGLVGMLGMRKLRRFGMGGPHALMQFGERGLHTWMCRPLLTFSKARLKATCQAANVPWMDDPTNIDPTVSKRNAIRATLAELHDEGDNSPWSEKLKRFQMTDAARAQLASVLDGVPLTASVTELTEHMSAVHDQLDAEVDEFLHSITTVEPGTPMLVVDCQRIPPSEQVAFGAILRILRYLSPAPWGHPLAQAQRRTERLRHIAENLWFRKRSPIDGLYPAAPFSGGAVVQWVPSERRSGAPRVTWMATRQTPQRNSAPLLFVDLSTNILEAAKGSDPPAPILWDNRFNIHIPTRFPRNVIRALEEKQGRVVLGPNSKFFLPMINFEHGDENTVLAKLDTDGHPRSYVKPGGWRFEWIRPFNDV
ncbi:hypothetical protein CALVIDRAFT_553635 [Calocera viscosa TUFC12733]|uniref:tRNA(Ile)-lysidine synthetase n=1 Tax=Calocera viscosa (strain TUFC12733) TaxID=1330018 RepID=A0A167PI04_CALVF|nr:hypothetical protein CALVIDRAFT_553635 [Calocera viscosa TUFC12733]